MATVRGPRIVTSGLILALDAADKKSYSGSGTAWNDLSGNNRNGTLTNGPTFSSANGGSVVFDGVDDYVRTSSLSLTGNETALTISCWFRPTSVSVIKAVVSLGDEATGKRRMLLQRNAIIEANGYNVDWGSSNLLTINTWCNINIVYTSYTVSTGVALYFNGYAVAGSGSNSSLSAFTNTQCTICGNNATPATENAGGNISKVMIYNRALSASEVLQNFNSTRGRFGI